MSMDLVNAAFELGGTFMMLPTLIHAWRLREVRGVHLSTPLFFWIWGVWNIAYYPALGQSWSFAAGCLLTFTNTLWIGTVWALTTKTKDA